MTPTEKMRSVVHERMDEGRRKALKSTLATLGGLACGSALTSRAEQGASAPSRAARGAGYSIVADGNAPIVETSLGTVIGYFRNQICCFKGIPYADTTEGDNRFSPPRERKPWAGVRSSRQYGSVAPQGERPDWADDEWAFMFSWDDGVQGEDCLRVNIWSPAVNDGRKRPVMVWLHGGGFEAGSGQELKSYDGENLARRGDVVVVTLNHRLNVLGFLDLSQYGERYADSVNVGMLDIIAALRWVRKNIAAFGGDPDAVTIFGQSGGGAKVSTLMAMPAAKGLFHRAIVQSGSMLRAGTQERSRQFARLVVNELGLNKASIGRIHRLPYAQLLSAATKVFEARRPKKTLGPPNFLDFSEMLAFLPVVDGVNLPAHPFEAKAGMLSADVPVIIGTTLNEFVSALSPYSESMQASELETQVKNLYGTKAAEIIAAFRRRTPAASPLDLWSHIASANVRAACLAQAAAKAALGRAPAFVYWFTWQTPILDRRPRAFHCAEIAFVFDNTDRCENMTGGGADARGLAAVMSDAWIQFARTGKPDHAHLPHWTPYDVRKKPTMIFDNETVLVDDPDGEEQNSIAAT